MCVFVVAFFIICLVCFAVSDSLSIILLKVTLGFPVGYFVSLFSFLIVVYVFNSKCLMFVPYVAYKLKELLLAHFSSSLGMCVVRFYCVL